jgi:hypothetical protein
MILIPVAMFVAFLGWLLRKFGPLRVGKEPPAIKDIFWVTVAITGFTVVFIAFSYKIAVTGEYALRTPVITELKELKDSAPFIIIKAKVSEDTEKKSGHSEFAAWYDSIGQGQRRLTISLEGGDALIENGNYEPVFWPRQVDMATTLFAIGKNDLIVVGGRITSSPSTGLEQSGPDLEQPDPGLEQSGLGLELTKIDADFVIAGDLVDLKWHVRSGRVYPALLAMLIALYGLGNLSYTFWMLKKLRELNNNDTSKEEN